AVPVTIAAAPAPTATTVNARFVTLRVPVMLTTLMGATGTGSGNSQAQCVFRPICLVPPRDHRAGRPRRVRSRAHPLREPDARERPVGQSLSVEDQALREIPIHIDRHRD